MLVTRVTDEADKPIEDALVMLGGVSRSARTDRRGEATFADVPLGRHRVEVRHVGYAPTERQADISGDTVSLHFVLVPLPPVLDTVHSVTVGIASDRLRAFESRRSMGIGRFLTEAALDSSPSVPIADIMMQRFIGVSSVGGRTVARRGCGALDVYVDGVRLTSRRSGLSRMRVPDAVDLRNTRGADVAGVEYYDESNAPAQFRDAGTACGVVLIWLRP